MNTLFLSEIFVLDFQYLPSLFEILLFMFLNTRFVDFFAALFFVLRDLPINIASFDHPNMVT